MNALLIYPEYPKSFYSYDEALTFISKKGVNPPLGILTVAAMLPENWNKRFIDCNVTPLKDDDIAWADMVFISAMAIHHKKVIELIKRCKRYDKTIVAGGPLFTGYYELEDKTYDFYSDIDHIILNEAEITLPPFLKDLENGEPKAVYTSKKRPDIKKTPLPLWSLVDIHNYAHVSVQYSRGCPFNCDFCDIILHNGRTPRLKTSIQMVREFQVLYEAGWRGTIFIVDDNFIGNIKKVKEMLSSLIAWQKEKGYPFSLTTQVSINIADDDELLNLMVQANFVSFFIGFETPNKESLKECGKFQNANRELLDSVKKIQKKGIELTGGFIVGFDNDNEATFDAQIDFIQNSAIVLPMINILNVPPLTQLWYRLKSEGRLLDESTGDGTDGTIQFKSKMGNNTLLKGYVRVISTIFEPNVFYKRIGRLIQNIQPNAKSKYKKGQMKTFFKSILKIGFFSTYKAFYWRLLLKTLFSKPKAFSIAVKLAILGEHFIKYSQKVVNKLSLLY